MGDTNIEWTDKTWNPVEGCSMAKGSEAGGCLNCYAARTALRRPSSGLAVMRDSGPRWTGKVGLVEKRLYAPLRWRKPQRIFVNSMSDLFHESLSFADILRVHMHMLGADQHTYQVLTKRPEIAKEFYLWWDRTCPGHAYPRDLWVGASIENQQTADLRIPVIASLSSLPLRTFLSYEPALGPVDFTKHFWIGEEGGIDFSYTPRQQISWVIVGGESGPGARPFEVAWAKRTIEQCKAAKIPCFVKQLGAVPVLEACRQWHFDWGAGIGRSDPKFSLLMPKDPDKWRIHLEDRKGGDMSEWQEYIRVREFPGAPR